MTEEINPKMSTIVFVKQIFYFEPPDFASSLVRTSFLGWIINNLCHSSTNSPEYTNSVFDLGFLKYEPKLISTLELIVQKSQVFPQIIC